MTDSNCTRAGYDSTGRYHVPEITHDVGDIYPPDPCPRCGTHHPKWYTCDEAADSTAADQCPDCRCAPGQSHHPDCETIGSPIAVEDENVSQPVNIPWPVQLELFHLHATQALDALPGYLHLYGDRIMAMAAARMEDGYHEYGSTMFTWDAETRLQNVLEELADAVVYLISGGVE